MSSAAQDLQALLVKLRPQGGVGVPRPPLVLGWRGLDESLHDGGLPSGVVELAASGALGGCTSVALAAVHVAQARTADSWCAWVDPERTLHAPGVVAAGVDLERFLVVAAPRARLGQAAVKLTASGAFEVVVVDVDPAPFAEVSGAKGGAVKRGWPLETLVRKLALAAEPSGTTVLLLTDSTRVRATLPVALRLELHRPSGSDLSLRITKDRRGRVGLSRTIPFRPAMQLAG